MMRTLYAALIISFLVLSAQAQTVQIDLSKLDSDRAAQVLQAQKEAKDSTGVVTVSHVAIPTIDQAKQLANVGEEVAGAIAAAAKALSISVNDFMTTPVGWWTFIFIFWYFLGAKLWAIVGGMIVWLVLGCVIWRSFHIFHMNNRVLLREEGKTKFYEYQRYEFKSNDARTTSACFHAGAFIVLSGVMLTIVL